MFDIINIPMGYVIRFFNNIMGNQYVLALLLFAIAVEILLLPFAIKQQKNTIKQAKLRPKEMAIRKKYAGRDDNPTKQKMAQEIQELYQKEGYNPMGGCFPLLIQFPIIIALYNLVMNPLKYICGLSEDAIHQISSVVSAYTGTTYDEIRNINLLGDIRSYSLGYENFANVEGFTEEMFNNLPNLQMFGGAIDLGQIPTLSWPPTWLLLVPILTFVAYFASMKVSRKLTYQPQTNDKAMGCSNAMMDIMMPLLSVYISFIVPAAIGVYWIFKSVIGMVKQIILHFAMPAPTFTEEDYKKAESEMAAADAKAGKKKSSSGRVVRSLHHIDDEDFADTAEAGKARREALEAQAAADEEARANKARGNALRGDVPVMKEDDRPARKKKKKDESEEKSDDTDNTNKDGE